MATRKTTGAGKGGEGREAGGSSRTTGEGKPTGTGATRAKVGVRPRLKVGSRPVSAAPRTSAAAARRAASEAEAPAALRAKSAASTPTKTSVPPPPGAVPARARAAVKPVKKAAAKDDPGRRVALAIAAAGVDKKATDIEIVDVRGRVDYADYVVVMSGRSDRQVSALARNIEEDLLKKEKVRCAGVEGLGQGAWVLMDFGDVIVHVFHEETRGYYDLESLWGDAPRVEPLSRI